MTTLNRRWRVGSPITGWRIVEIDKKYYLWTPENLTFGLLSWSKPEDFERSGWKEVTDNDSW